MTALELLLLLGAAVGAGAARVLRVPMWSVTGSIAGAGITQLLLDGSGSMPGWSGLVGQLLVGIALGSAIDPAVLRQFRSTLAPGCLVVVTLLVTGVAGAAAIASTGRLGVPESVLGTIPGGVGEMVAAATALQVDSAVVAGMHVTRLLVVLLTLPLLIRWASRTRGP